MAENDDDFDSIWDSIPDEDEELNVPPVEETPLEETPPEEPPPEEPPPEEPPPEEPPPEEPPPEEPPPTDDVDYKALYERAQAEVQTQTGRLKAEQERYQRELEALQTRPPQKDPEPLPETEEDKFLQAFVAEYDDKVVKAINLIADRRAKQLIDETVTAKVAPIQQTTEEMLTNIHFGAIETAHPDAFEIDASPAFNAWIEAKPVHLRGAYEFVRKQGTPTEVIAMLDEYKEAVKMKPSKKSSGAPDTKVDAAAAVPRARGVTQVPKAPALDDFDAAWEEAPE